MASTAAAHASEMIPFTQTFVQTQGGSPVTTQYTLVGQVLNNGQTNWVGYNQGSAEYLFTSSAADASQTTLADGATYFVSRGSAPAGYLATGGGNVAAPTQSSNASPTSDDSDSNGQMSASQQDSGTMMTMAPSGSSDSGSDSAASPSTTPSSGQRLSAGAILAVLMGILAVVAM